MSLVAVRLSAPRAVTGIDEQIARNVRSRRLAAGISVEVVAEACGTSWQAKTLIGALARGE